MKGYNVEVWATRNQIATNLFLNKKEAEKWAQGMKNVFHTINNKNYHYKIIPVEVEKCGYFQGCYDLKKKGKLMCRSCENKTADIADRDLMMEQEVI